MALMNPEAPNHGGIDAPGADLPEDPEQSIDPQEFCIKVCVYRDHTYSVTEEPLDVDANARNGGYEAEGGPATIDNAEDALREVYRMMKDAMETGEEQDFQSGFGPPKERMA